MSAFARALEEDLDWRQAELASLKRLAIYSRDNDTSYRASLRALWTMLYAHFEGFTKFCWESVLNEIEHSKTPRRNLRDSVAILSLEQVFSVLRGDTSAAGLWRALRTELPNHLNDHARFPKKCRLETRSNLWPDLFHEQNLRLGIVCEQMTLNEVRMKALVGRRNDIAHGEPLIVKSVSEYSPYEGAALHVMHELALCCIDYVEKRVWEQV